MKTKKYIQISIYWIYKIQSDKGQIIISLLVPRFPMPYVMIFFVFNKLGEGMVDCFLDISGITDHHCLNFL